MPQGSEWVYSLDAMGHPHIKKRSLDKIDEILLAAAQLILETGKREVDITELAKRSGVSRPSIHAVFGKTGKGEESSAKAVIYRRIVNEFLGKAQILIEGVLSSLPPTTSPIEKLISVFRATLTTFNNNQEYGMVVLQQLNLADKDENAAIFYIFAQVDQIMCQARAEGQLNKEATERFEDFEIRQIIFTVTRGLLRASYLKEAFPIKEDGTAGEPGLKLEKVEVEILRMLQLYCNQDAKEIIDENIKLVIKEQSASAVKSKPKPTPSKSKL